MLEHPHLAGFDRAAAGKPPRGIGDPGEAGPYGHAHATVRDGVRVHRREYCFARKPARLGEEQELGHWEQPVAGLHRTQHGAVREREKPLDIRVGHNHGSDDTRH